MEKNRDRNEYRTCQICNNASNLTKKQKEWTTFRAKLRINQGGFVEKDSQGNDNFDKKRVFEKRLKKSHLLLKRDWKTSMYGRSRPYPHGEEVGGIKRITGERERLS